jgi:diaminopimelate epimerase
LRIKKDGDYMKFTKMHGCGNEYIYIDCFKEEVNNPEKLAIWVSDRHFGIGSDGLILIKPSDKSDFYMDMYNADGSQGKMCGNGIRCVAKYVYDNKMTDKDIIKIETLSGEKTIEVFIGDDNLVATAKVDMGSPILNPLEIPVLLEGESIIDRGIMVDDNEYHITCVSMGNPHAVLFVEDTMSLDLEKIGPLFEHNELFPERINTEFVQIIDRNTIKMRVWERGSGETLACGTGACASVVASVLNNKTEDEVLVHLKGGDLFIKYDREKNTVFMTGPAEVICTGELNLKGDF